MKLQDVNDGTVQVDILVDWTAFLAIISAVIIGMAIYDIAMILSHRAADLGSRAWADFRDWLSERYPYGFWAAFWDRIMGEPQEEPGEHVPDQDSTPEPVESPYRATGNGVLHKSSCRIVTAGLHFSPGYPWPWASTEEDALHYAREQELRPCGACDPCGDLSEVDQWWK